MSETFEVKCVDCANEFAIVSPAHLICQKCGSGQLEFRNAVVFTCHKGHEQRGRIADELCKGCHSFEQRTLRNFEKAWVVKSKPEPVEDPDPAEKKTPPKKKRTIKEKTTKIKTRKKK